MLRSLVLGHVFASATVASYIRQCTHNYLVQENHERRNHQEEQSLIRSLLLDPMFILGTKSLGLDRLFSISMYSLLPLHQRKNVTKSGCFQLGLFFGEIVCCVNLRVGPTRYGSEKTYALCL